MGRGEARARRGGRGGEGEEGRGRAMDRVAGRHHRRRVAPAAPVARPSVVWTNFLRR